MTESISQANLQILLIFTEKCEIFCKMFSHEKLVTCIVDVWSRSEIFRKSKISQGVKPDYYDQICKSTKFADNVNFYRILQNISENDFA